MREDVSFYETSAQVIPLLLLAAGLETGFLKDLRPFSGPRERARNAVSDAIMLPLAVALVLAGEVAALHASLVGHSGWLAERLTGGALLVGFWGVFTPILNVVLQTTRDTVDEYAYAARRPRLARAVGRVASMAIHGSIYVMAGLLATGLFV